MSDKLPEEIPFDIHSEIDDNASVSDKAPSIAPTILLDEEEPHVTKKVKLYKRKYNKTSWVWKYFNTDQDGKYDICQVSILNLQNKEVHCGQRFLHDGSTGNMANHLHGKHSIHEEMNKVII